MLQFAFDIFSIFVQSTMFSWFFPVFLSMFIVAFGLGVLFNVFGS